MKIKITPLKALKPVNNSHRGVIRVCKKNLWSGRPLSSLTERIVRTGGRNNTGRVTSRHIGGGHRKIYRKMDFFRKKDGIPAVVERIEYDPNRTGFIALIKYEDGEYNYITATTNMKVGDVVESGVNAPISEGNCLPIANIPVGTIIHNLELFPGSGAKLIRSAGAGIYLTGKELGYAILKMRSKETRKISLDCRATIGTVSNEDHLHENWGKAGRSRHNGIRPRNRGVARNPVDHHNGGRTHGGKIFTNQNGRISKGMVTRKKKNSDSMIIMNKRRARRS